MSTELRSLRRLHLIAIGGSIMHNLALALQRQGVRVTGSDDEIFDPARSRLAAAGLLPSSEGWAPDRIQTELDAVIVGMHARRDNPELSRARELGLPTYSFPELIYESSKHKQRVVIGGSHGKTSITAVIIHVLKQIGRHFDFAVGAQIEGFDCMVRLSDDAPLIVIEGDEYLSSPIDRRPKFHLYRHHIGVISGINWDHINVFPTEADYREQFRLFADMTPEEGVILYDQDDEQVRLLGLPIKLGARCFGYGQHPHKIRDGQTFLLTEEEYEVPIEIFGEHNLRNISAAKEVCSRLNVDLGDFYKAVSSFKGAARRLELVTAGAEMAVYKDFAHSPSKVRATVSALKKQYPRRRLVACLELHTFSSVNQQFLPRYAGALDLADIAVVYFNPRVLENKCLPPLTPRAVAAAFEREDLAVFTESPAMLRYLLQHYLAGTNVLMMSSATFNGLDLSRFSQKGPL